MTESQVIIMIFSAIIGAVIGIAIAYGVYGLVTYIREWKVRRFWDNVINKRAK